MKRSTDRILTTHVGSLIRPPEIMEFMRARTNNQPYDEKSFAKSLQIAVAQVVRQQAEIGIDVISDGEFGKTGFAAYIGERLTGFEQKPHKPGDPEEPIGKDRKNFAAFYADYDRMFGFGRPGGRTMWVCTGPITYKPQLIQIDIANFKTALNDEKVEEAFMPVVAPATVEMGRRNEYYSNDEAYLYAIADALKE